MEAYKYRLAFILTLSVEKVKKNFMVGIYRKKTCPVCGVEHRKRGPYCSKSHAMQDRKITDEHKAKLSEAGLKRFEDKSGEEYLNAVDHLRQATAVSKGRDTTPIPPRQQEFRSGEVIDGDYWVSGDDW